MKERCEWNPVDDVPSLDPAHPNDCQEETWWSVGSGSRNFHVCNSCAERPVFYRFRKWTPINANPLLDSSKSLKRDDYQ